MSEPQNSKPEHTPRTGNLTISPPSENTKKIRRQKAKEDETPRTRLRAYFCLITIVILVFSPLLASDVLWTEYDTIERSAYQSMDTWQDAWTLDSIRANDPITVTSYFLEKQIPLPTPAVDRGINILLHILAAILLLKNLETLKLPAAFSAALIFALHPATLQTIFWSGYRTEIIGLICILSALYFGSRNRGTADFMATICFTAAACVVHPAALAIPVILALIILNQQRHFSFQSFNRVLPLLCLCLFLGVWLNSGTPATEPTIELNSTERLNHAGQSMSFFTQRTFLPISPQLFTPFQVDDTYQKGAQMSTLPFLLFVPFFILITLNIKKMWSRAILLGLSSYLLIIIIYGLPQKGYFIDGSLAHEDRTLYIALPFMLALVITGAGRLIDRMDNAGKPIWFMGCSVLLFIEIALTASFAYAISDSTRMWQAMEKRWPESWEVEAAQIDSIERGGDTDLKLNRTDFILLLESTLEQRPDLIDKRILFARTLAEEGQNSNATREYKRILREIEQPDNELLEEAATFFDTVGLQWDAAKTRERKTKTP